MKGANVVVFGSGLFFGDAGIRGFAIAVPGGTVLVLVASMLSVRSPGRTHSRTPASGR